MGNTLIIKHNSSYLLIKNIEAEKNRGPGFSIKYRTLLFNAEPFSVDRIALVQRREFRRLAVLAPRPPLTTDVRDPQLMSLFVTGIILVRTVQENVLVVVADSHPLPLNQSCRGRKVRKVLVRARIELL